MGDLDRLDALASVYDEQANKIRSRLEAFARQLWESQSDYRDDAMDRLVAAILPRVQAGQVQSAQLTRAYMIECARELGLSTDLALVNTAEVTGVRGVDPTVVYHRPARTVYAALSEGKPIEEAVAAGGLRLLQIIGGDMQLATRQQAHKSMRQAGVTVYRRILTGRENCALCMLASTQRYWVKDLMPIHPGCDCKHGPLPPDYDASQQVIDADMLDRIHDEVYGSQGLSDRSGRVPDYRDLVLEYEHGEYGPCLKFKETRQERRKRFAAEKKTPQA